MAKKSKIYKDISDGKLAWLKRQARKEGFVAEENNAFGTFLFFYEKHELNLVSKTGKVMEVIMAFILGMIQSSLIEKGIRFWIVMDEADDSVQIDFRLNAGLIQQKFDWPEDDAEAVQDSLRFRGIKVINIPKYVEGIDHSIIDDIVLMLREAGLNEKEITAEIDDDPAMDIAEQLWVWYSNGIVS